MSLRSSLQDNLSPILWHPSWNCNVVTVNGWWVQYFWLVVRFKINAEVLSLCFYSLYHVFTGYRLETNPSKHCTSQSLTGRWWSRMLDYHTEIPYPAFNVNFVVSCNATQQTQQDVNIWMYSTRGDFYINKVPSYTYYKP